MKQRPLATRLVLPSRNAKSGTSTFSVETALHRIDRNPAGAARWLRRKLKKTEESARMTSYIVVGAAYGLAERLHEDPKFRARFKRLRFWHGHSTLNEQDFLRYALMFIYDSHQGPNADRARDHARALKDHWDRGTPARDIPQILARSGGFDGLKAKKRKREREVDDDAKLGSKLKPTGITIDASDVAVQSAWKALPVGQGIRVLLMKRGPARGEVVRAAVSTEKH